MARNVIKRSGKTVNFNEKKIQTAITRANKDVKTSDPLAKIMTNEDISTATNVVIDSFKTVETVNIEDIQDTVEKTLMSLGFFEIAKSYILYRKKHQEQREASLKLMEQFHELLSTDAALNDDRRENANINTNTPMGIMLKAGTSAMKIYADNFAIPEEFVAAEREGWTHWHDKDFSFICFNCLQTDLKKVFSGGFNTGHGYIREPKSIRSYAALAAIVLQSAQNDCFGGQSLGAFDVVMSDGIRKSFKSAIKTAINQLHVYEGDIEPDILTDFEIKRISFNLCHYSDDTNKSWQEDKNSAVQELMNVTGKDRRLAEIVYLSACNMVKEETHQAMEAFLFNMNTLHSRSGSQTVFSSINYGLDTTPEGRLVVREMLKVTDAGMGHGETSIFPIQIFTMLAGVNYNFEDPNYDLFQQAMRVSAKRLYPNFNSQGSSFNLPYYKPEDYRTYAATMGK